MSVWLLSSQVLFASSLVVDLVLDFVRTHYIPSSAIQRWGHEARKFSIGVTRRIPRLHRFNLRPTANPLFAQIFVPVPRWCPLASSLLHLQYCLLWSYLVTYLPLHPEEVSVPVTSTANRYNADVIGGGGLHVLPVFQGPNKFPGPAYKTTQAKFTAKLLSNPHTILRLEAHRSRGWMDGKDVLHEQGNNGGDQSEVRTPGYRHRNLYLPALADPQIVCHSP